MAVVLILWAIVLFGYCLFRIGSDSGFVEGYDARDSYVESLYLEIDALEDELQELYDAYEDAYDDGYQDGFADMKGQSLGIIFTIAERSGYGNGSEFGQQGF